MKVKKITNISLFPSFYEGDEGIGRRGNYDDQ